MLDDVVVMVLAGGVGERLYPLTKERAKPAVYFGGPYRIIDFTLSNCINSGLRKIFIVTQYKAQSLIRHIERSWGFLEASLGEFVDIVPAQQQIESRKELMNDRVEVLMTNGGNVAKVDAEIGRDLRDGPFGRAGAAIARVADRTGGERRILGETDVRRLR